MVKILILFLFFLICLEIFLYRLVNFLRKYYNNSHNWLKNRYVTNIITKNKDLFPKIIKEDLFKFKIYMHDKILGSTYKKNTSVIEKYYDNKKIIRTKYTIQKSGSRINYLFKNKNHISTYGDSLTFCRYVNDNQTWQYHLSKKTKSNVKNYGVGNYGLDQSYLRYLQNKNDKSKIVIFAVGPETIRRNLSLWKHYYEFGNIYYFKPAYLLNKKGKLKKNSLSIKNFSLKTNFNNIHKKIKDKDIFFREKFSQYLWVRPYLFSLTKNFQRKVILIIFFSLKYIEIEKKNNFIKKILDLFFKDINQLGGLKYDFDDKVKYFKNKEYYKNTLELIKIISKDLKKKKKEGLLVIMPSQYDLIYRKKTKHNYYGNFIAECNKHINCMDLGDFLLKNNQKIHADKGYGGHFNDLGNKNISKIIFNYLNKNNYI
jgi:hypothetical protein